MDQSFSSPRPHLSERGPVCPPPPRGRKASVTFDGKNVVVVPLIFPSHCSVLGTNNTTAVIEENVDPARMNVPPADFTLRSRRCDSEAPARKIPIEVFPPLPFSFPRNQAPSSNPLQGTMPRSRSDPDKLRPYERHQSSNARIERRHTLARTTFNARCA